MNTLEHVPQADTTNTAELTKLPYAKPEILDFGNIREITRGGMSGVSDAKGGKRTR